MAGLHFEQFEVGHVFRHAVTRTVTEMDNTLFSVMTLNVQPLHLDAHFSEKTEFGQRLVNSLFTLGLVIGISVSDTTLGTTIANLLHLVNFAWANHADEPFDRRSNNHRYKRGFALNGRFAFTQGAVMSNLSRDSSDNLWHHEHLHVWQNRIFGPLFTITYVAWMILLFIPSLIVAAIARADFGDTIMALCYYNNPWEVWAYKVGGWRNPFMAWPDAAVIIAAILFYGGVLVAVGFVLFEVY